MDHFLTELSSFFKWLISSTLHVSVLICLILVIKVLIRHRLAVRWHYWLWLLLLVRMVMPWAPQSSFSVFSLLSQAKTSIVSKGFTEITPLTPIVDVAPEAATPSQAEEQVSFAVTTSPPAQAPASAASLEIMDILSLSWLVVALALAIAALACNFRLWRIIKSQRPLTEGKILDALEDCKAEMGIQTIVGVIVTDKVKSPALFGTIRPRLLLPEGIIETLTPEELRYVFLHELAHLKRHDIYLGWVMVVLQVLHWFNPLVWLAFNRMRADRELACDGLVLSTAHADESQRYGTTIVNIFTRFSQIRYLPGIAGILEDKSQIKRRVTMIARFKKGSYRWSTMAVALLAVLGCVFLTNAQPVSQAQKNKPEAMAKEFVELLTQGQFAKAVEGFDAKMKKTLPKDKLAQTWRTTTGQAGLFKQQLGTRREKFLGSEIVYVTCEFEKGPMDVKVVYDSDKKVSGLWFLPTPQKVLDEYKSKKKDKSRLTPKRMTTVMLSHNDGSTEGKKSIAGSGHAVLFEAPTEGYVLKAVRIYGSRYGYPAPPKENFHIWLCDKDLKVIKDFPFPYSRFARGNPKWVTLRVAPTPVPENFIICVGFKPQSTKGVYVHYDNSTSGNSFTGLPRRGSRVFNQGEWMIQALLSAPAVRAEIDPAGLVGYWKFDGNAEDSAGNNDGTIYGAQWVAGRIGNTLRFDGIDDYVRVDNNSSMNFGASTDFSVGFWIKASIQDSAVISKGPEIPPHGWTGWSPGWNIQLENTVEHKAGVRFDMYDGNNGGSGIVTTGVDALDNNWHHVFITVDRDGYAKAYLDASEKDSRDVSSIGDINNSRELLIGWRGDWLYFDGLIDEIAIYKRVLSAEEIGEIYQSGLPDIVDLEIIGPNEVAEESRAVGEVNSRTGEKSDGPQWVSSDWKGASKGDYALKFNGSSNYVKIPSSPSLDIRGSLTLSAWVKNDGDNDAHIIWRGDNQLGKDPYMIYVANNRMVFGLDPGEGIVTYTAKSREILDNNWHLWTATYDSRAKTMGLYKDGQLESTAEAPVGFKYDTSKMWNTIGAIDFGNWQHFKGTIDEVRIWNRSLTPQEIQQAADGIYKANDPNLVAHWNFNEGEGNTIHDVTPNNNLGQLHTWTGRTGYISPRRRQPPRAVAPGQSAPVVVRTSPQAFANDIDPSLKIITVTFDRTMMDNSWSWTGGGDTYPKMAGRPYYDQSKRTCTMPVTLEPGKVYWVGINSPSHKNFKTPSRQAASWYIILFATRSANGKPTTIPRERLARAKRINAAAGKPSPARLGPKTTPDGKLVIPSQRPWTDTGINVKAGQEIRLLATGTIHGCRGPKRDWAYGPWGPDGKLFEQGHVAAAGMRLFALVGRIGGKEFHVGSNASITAPANGRLHLGVSDSYHSDNVGAFTVEVEVSPAIKPVSDEDKRQAENLSAEGWRLWKQRKLVEAEKTFKRALAKDPNNANGWNGLGWAQQNQGKPLNAKTAFEKCLAIDPKHPAALNGLGWIAHGQGQKDEAITWWEKAVTAAPGATASLSGLTKVYMERKDYAQPVKYYQMWLDAEPGSAEAKSGLAKAKSSLQHR